jgi:hypothetical protein
MSKKTAWQLVREGMVNYSIEAVKPEIGEQCTGNPPSETTSTLSRVVSFEELDPGKLFSNEFRVGNIRLSFKDDNLVRLWIDETQGVWREFTVAEYKPDFKIG